MNDTLKNNITVSVKYGELDEVIAWCTMNCNLGWDLSEVTEYGGSANGSYQFSFHDDKDAVYFSLRWA